MIQYTLLFYLFIYLFIIFPVKSKEDKNKKYKIQNTVLDLKGITSVRDIKHQQFLAFHQG